MAFLAEAPAVPQTATLESLGLTWATNQVQFSGHRCHAIIGNRTQAYNQADKSVGVLAQPQFQDPRMEKGQEEQRPAINF